MPLIAGSYQQPQWSISRRYTEVALVNGCFSVFRQLLPSLLSLQVPGARSLTMKRPTPLGFLHILYFKQYGCNFYAVFVMQESQDKSSQWGHVDAGAMM